MNTCFTTWWWWWWGVNAGVKEDTEVTRINSLVVEIEEIDALKYS